MLADIVEKKKTTSKLKEPSKYRVIVCNDDYTPMDFVVTMLMKIFNHDKNNAIRIMLAIHHEGSGVAGEYNFEIAEQKVTEGTHFARANNFPLVLKMESTS
jgi:ATP-dependent Clp protease adaptor protein ClpS